MTQFTQKHTWWEDPITDEEIPGVVDKMFQLSKDNLWTKVLRPCVESELKDEVEAKKNKEAENIESEG